LKIILASDQKERERQLLKSEMIPLERTQLSFWQKFRELQIKMFWQSETVQNHMYSSEPLEWPLMSKGIAYWYQKDTNVRILNCFKSFMNEFMNNSSDKMFFCYQKLFDLFYIIINDISYQNFKFSLLFGFRHKFISLATLLYGIHAQYLFLFTPR